MVEACLTFLATLLCVRTCAGEPSSRTAQDQSVRVSSLPSAACEVSFEIPARDTGFFEIAAVGCRVCGVDCSLVTRKIFWSV